MGSFALLPIVGCEILVMGVDKADPTHRSEPVRVNDGDGAYPTVSDGNTDGGTEPPKERE